jgi:hypothetical protein
MLTFEDQYTIFQKVSKDYSAEGLEDAKRDINEGGAQFLNRLGRKFNKEYITASLTATEQYYQLPGDVLRISEIQCKSGNNWYTPELVASELEWNRINSMSSTGNIPTHYYIRGFNEIGVYPVPSTTVTDGIKISYEPQHVELTQADYATGTVSVVNGSVDITHSGSGFNQSMVGRYFHVTDGSDGRWYRIASFTSTSSLKLENFYEGVTGSRAFRIGEVMKIPQGFQKAPVDYALSVFYETEGSAKDSEKYLLRFERALKQAKKSYAHSTSRQGTKKSAAFSNPGRGWIDYTNPVTYP